MEKIVYHYVIIDDNESIQSFIPQVLNDCDGLCMEQCFGNLSDAVCYLKRHPVDLLFLDLSLPDMDGLDLFEQIENPPYTIVMTAYTNQYSQSVCLNMNKGIMGYLAKPFSSEDLLDVVEKFKNRKLF